ncbi:hypothetical protein HN51_061769 [Arachis hypogaea]|uniref:GATA-type domain-containing protein n=1 Tax=Arachis hypogaea TaxID=3818 RepID=A0A445APN5_ARAHY|nr:GATA transcription factor 19 [Arachis ipaensis]XP_025627069.1 GATA transcription factor 19 [Arachis hypogaea]QHO19093.1 GATA transcription factor [Arachis hypogaea]RYR28397.1 hypothetical protein Ahy_B01g052505 [Arachis hypogaea]
MMNHCCSNSNSQDHVMGTCKCGMFPTPYGDDYYYGDPNSYSFTPSSSSLSWSSVDCTLSLGTPSTRFSEDEDRRTRHHHHERRSKQNPHHSEAKASKGSDGDAFFSRRCANCDTTSTPLWRNGPRGPKTLCNACGIRYKKEERRASATAAATTTTVTNSGGEMEPVAAHMYGRNNNNSWYYTNSQGNNNGELRFMDYDANDDMDPFPSWRLNAADRTNLVHDFTR